MEEAVRRLNAEYGFNLNEEEIQQIARQAEEANRLFEPLFAVDLTGVTPILKMDLRSQGSKTKREKKR
ncbi:MAG: hypothetical protein HY695_32390 [Deltaproteobacteria bacterium]|nr:hypothetical protein [Deltaproteobacteria bacterium]